MNHSQPIIWTADSEQQLIQLYNSHVIRGVGVPIKDWEIIHKKLIANDSQGYLSSCKVDDCHKKMSTLLNNLSLTEEEIDAYYRKIQSYPTIPKDKIITSDEYYAQPKPSLPFPSSSLDNEKLEEMEVEITSNPVAEVVSPAAEAKISSLLVSSSMSSSSFGFEKDPFKGHSTNRKKSERESIEEFYSDQQEMLPLRKKKKISHPKLRWTKNKDEMLHLLTFQVLEGREGGGAGKGGISQEEWVMIAVTLTEIFQEIVSSQACRHRFRTLKTNSILYL